jgi:hypothetical protein
MRARKITKSYPQKQRQDGKTRESRFGAPGSQPVVGKFQREASIMQRFVLEEVLAWLREQEAQRRAEVEEVARCRVN